MNYKVIFGVLIIATGIIVFMAITGCERTLHQSKNGDPDDTAVVSHIEGMTDSHVFNNTIVLLSPENVTRVEYIGEDREEVFVRELGGAWLYAGMQAVDSAAMADYLGGIHNLVSEEIIDTSEFTGEASCAIRLTGNNMEPVELLLFKFQELPQRYIIKSSLNPDMYFASDSAGVYRKIFGEFNLLLAQM